MIWQVIEVLTTIFDCFIYAEFNTRYLGWKYGKSKKSYIGFFLAALSMFLMVTIFNNYMVFEGALALLYTVIFIVYGVFYLNGSIFEKVMVATIINVLYMILNVFMLSIFNYISNYQIAELITSRGAIRLFLILSTKSVIFFLTRMFFRTQKKNKFNLAPMEWAAIFSIFVVSFITAALAFELIVINPKNDQNAWIAVLITIGLIIINVLSYYIFVIISAKNREKFRYSLKDLQLSEQEKSLKEMRTSYEEVRKIRHDMKNYMECAINLLHNEKPQEAMNYLQSLQDNKMSLGNQFAFTDSDAVNAVLNSKISQSKQYGIKFDYQISGSLKSIEEIDLSILLANLIDNAIEACKEVDYGEIKLKIYEERNYLVINIHNSIKSSILAKNPRLVTTKKDKDRHGLGTLSIRDIVEQYHGMLNYSEENGQFVSDIWLMKTEK